MDTVAEPPNLLSMSSDPKKLLRLSMSEWTQFQNDGYLIVRQIIPAAIREQMLAVTLEGIAHAIEPIEYESELQYPGAPPSLAAEGGRTIRRLKQAHTRHQVFTQWLNDRELLDRLADLLGPKLVMPLAHHNCIMTKQPHHSSDTGWHQDIRYWSFERPELISVWLALGAEYPRNGSLLVIPGSHRMTLERDRFDDALFFRTDHPANADMLAQAVPVELAAGDVLFFHCRTLHAASRNYADATKYSVVFTFRAASNPPRPGSRSAQAGELLLPEQF